MILDSNLKRSLEQPESSGLSGNIRGSALASPYTSPPCPPLPLPRPGPLSFGSRKDQDIIDILRALSAWPWKEHQHLALASSLHVWNSKTNSAENLYYWKYNSTNVRYYWKSNSTEQLGHGLRSQALRSQALRPEALSPRELVRRAMRPRALRPQDLRSHMREMI